MSMLADQKEEKGGKNMTLWCHSEGMNIQDEQDPSEGAPIPSFCKYVEEPQSGKISIVDTVFELRILIDMLIVPGIIACVPPSTKQSVQAVG